MKLHGQYLTVSFQTSTFRDEYSSDFQRIKPPDFSPGVYEGELKEIEGLWKKTEDESKRSQLTLRALHAMQFFSFYASTPAGTVSVDSEESFFRCDVNVHLQSFELGPNAANQVRLPNSELSGFIKIKLRDRRMISEITLEDVFKELETGATTDHSEKVSEICDLQVSSSESHPSSLQRATEIIMSLSEASTFINIKLIPTDVPLPNHCLPFSLTKSLNSESLRRVFGFRELNILEFTTHLFSSELKGTDRITDSPPLAEQFLNILCKAWTSLSNDQRTEINLAVVCLPSGIPVKGTMTKVLSDIGVRKHVELQMVFSRLLGSGEWNHSDLVKYLVSVKDILTDIEIDKLRQTNWLPKEGEPKVELLQDLMEKPASRRRTGTLPINYTSLQ
ncbi:hypothetical protein KEM48_010528 [Puccinia striiformis f. sp. tritici PST-130]|nr:hypothetical protein KEM48_010528 [Puccinia striiformis f. sp. tritici PST-130]